MDYSNRTVQPQTVAPGTHATAAGGPTATSKRGKPDRGKMGRIITAALVAAVMILLIALVAFISFGNNANENKYVDTSKLQAVFLNTGQVYFGNIQTLNNRFFVLSNIYYLQTSNGSSSTPSTAANTSVSLVKLGCELHQPFDQMVINATQVTFWENLQTTGQVAKAVQTFEKSNPNGQKCSDQSSSSKNTTNSVQNASPSTTAPATTPTPATTTKP